MICEMKNIWKIDGRKKILSYISLVGLVVIVCFFMFLPNLIAQRPVTYGTDLKPEQLFFNMEFTNLITNFFKTGTFPFYSWSLFLGTNFYSSQTFYVMTDIFGWLGLLLNSVNFFDRTLLLEILKFIFSALAMYALLNEIISNKKIQWIGSICYAFSSWAIFYSGQLMFHSFYVFVPLYFWGIERYLKYNKKILFIMSVSILAFSNWYFFYTLSFFTPIYYIYRFYIINNGFEKILPKTAKIIGLYFIGVLLSGITLIPTLFYIRENNRLGLTTDLLFADKQIYLHILSAMFAPNYLYIYQSNVFETNWHVTRELCIWAGSFTSIGVLALLSYKEKKFKYATLLVYLVILILLICPIGNAAMHGFSEPSFRWTFIISTFNILVACHCMADENNIDKRKFKTYIFVSILLCVIIVPLTSFVRNDYSKFLTMYKDQWMLFTFCGGIMLIYSLLILKDSKNKISWFLVLTLVETSFFGYSLYTKVMDRSDRGTYEFVDKVTHVLQDNDNELNNYLNYLNDQNYAEYYRVYVPHDSLYWFYSHNMSVAYQLNGFMVYDSTYSPSINKLKDLAPQIVEYNSGMIFNIKDPDILQFLNVKYALVLNEDELPDKINWKLVEKEYRGSIQVFENLNYRPLGTTYGRIMTYEDYFESSSNLDVLNNTIICEEEDFLDVKSYLKAEGKNELINIEYSGNHLTGSCYSENDSFMIITLPFDKGWKILNNSRPMPIYNVNGGFIGIPVYAGENHIEMYFVPEGFKLGVLFSCVGIISFLVIILGEVRRKSKKSNLLL